MNSLIEFGMSHGREGIIHLQKWIKFKVEPNTFDRLDFIEANKNWLCRHVYEGFIAYLIENNFTDVIWEKDFLDLKQNEPYPSGIIYFEHIPIRWIYGAFLHDAIRIGRTEIGNGYKAYAMVADFIGTGIKKINDQ